MAHRRPHRRQLDCAGGTFRNPGRTALYGGGLTVDQDMWCGDGFTAEGKVVLIGAHLGSDFDCEGGTFRNPGGFALYGDGLTVDQTMLCRGGFTAEGKMVLIGAHLGSDFDCEGGTFRNPGGTALNATTLTVDQDMRCGGGFIAEGQVWLVRAHIGGQLDCEGGTFRNPGGAAALRLEGAEIGGNVFMRPAALDGALSLASARVGAWEGDAATWPKVLRLSGFTYTTIDARPPITVANRLRWLHRDPAGFLPQPYEQVAETYRREGHDDRARQVLIAKQRHRRASHRSRWRRWPAIAWSGVLRATIGYGYRPWLVLWPTVVLFLTGWWLFARDYDQGYIVPKADNPSTLTFNAARYTADLLLPVANLGERAKFTAVGDAAWHAFAYTLAGWLLAIVLIAGLSGVFKRD
ncbi:MAG TPA: hypothetical protein VGP87_03465 [Gemmatimonadales bacterium]|nr:hypothetical protein [Gemmatimonadales bacterium]